MVTFASFLVRALLAGTAFMAAASAGRGETILLDFSTPGCSPCREMQPVVSQLAGQGYRVREVDASREPHLARDFGVDRFPTFVAVVDGREFARIVGKTSGEQLSAMLRDAARQSSSEQLPGASRDPVTRGPDIGSPVTFVNEQPPEGPQSGPRPGRLVALQDDWAQNQRQPSANALPRGPSADRLGSQPDAGRLIAATVRLRVQDPEGASTGTGTIIDARQGRALVLTCGHIFRASAGHGTVLATLFKAGPGGAIEGETVAGRVVKYDLTRDLGLVEIAPAGEVAMAVLARRDVGLTPGVGVTSMGCNHGALPTALASQVTAVNRYGGTPNVEAAGAPVEGRSGGGLFNVRGELVGVCFAADLQGNEGLYASLDAICAQLDEQGLAFVYETGTDSQTQLASAAIEAQSAQLSSAQSSPAQSSPAQSSPAQSPAAQSPAAQSPAWENSFAATAPTANPSPGPLPFSTRGQSRDPQAALPGLFESPAGPPHRPVAPMPNAVSLLAAAAPSATGDPSTGNPGAEDSASGRHGTGLSAAEQATLEEIRRHGHRSEVICIIRPLTPEGTSDVIKIGNASPEFVEAITSRLPR